MRVVFVGVVKSAEGAFRALMDCGVEIVHAYTSCLSYATSESHMDPSYFFSLSQLAASCGIPCTEMCGKIDDYADEIEGLHPDYIYIIGWPQIVGQKILSIAPCIGMHPAPLPLRRGGAPLNWQLIDGVTESAVTLLRLEAGVDDGDILVQRPFKIGEADYIQDVVERVCEITYSAVKESCGALSMIPIQWKPQDSTQATVLRRRRPEDGLIDWNDSAQRVFNFVRAISRPFPGAFCYLEDGRQLIVWRARIPLGARPKLNAKPGEVLDFGEKRVIVSCRDYCLELDEVQLAERQLHANTSEMGELKDELRGTVLVGKCPVRVGNYSK